MTLSLLAAPSGVGLTEAVDRLAGEPDLEVFYVEREMLEDQATWERGRFPLALRHNMRDLLFRYTRRDVKVAWSRAFLSCINQADQSSSTNQIIAFHPSLYAKRRSEEYSTIEWIPPFSSQPPSQLLLLIDDIFDMWARLAEGPGDLFYQPEWLDLRLWAQDIQDTVLRRGGSLQAIPGDEDLFSRLVVDSSQAILSRLLAWRRLDMIEAESLAHLLNVRLTVLGTKHPIASLIRLLVDPRAHTTYLSHPISRPRTTRRSGADWPAVVAQSNALSPAFVSKSIALVCPTAIDELRFEQPAEPRNIHARRFLLDERWPLIVPAEDSIAGQGRTSNELTHIPVNSDCSPLEVVGAIARTLESQIFSEVPFRDHFLVTHTQSFFVFRPLYSTGEFSRGVKAEIEHWSDLRRIEPTRYAMYAHTKTDVQIALESFISSLSTVRIDEIMKRNLRIAGVNDEEIQAMTTGEMRPVALLDAETVDLEAQESLLRLSKENAVLALLFSKLTGLDVDYYPDSHIAVSIMQGDFPTDAETSAYSDFLREGVLDGSHFDFRRQLSEILDVDPVEWVASRLKGTT